MTPDIEIATETKDNLTKFLIICKGSVVSSFYGDQKEYLARFSNLNDGVTSWSDHVIVDGKLVEDK